MSTNRRVYSQEFKIQAVQLITEKGLSINEAARQLGIDPKLLRAWKKRMRDLGQNATSSDTKHLPLIADFKRLQEEIRELRMERDILKKAVAYFAKGSF